MSWNKWPSRRNLTCIACPLALPSRIQGHTKLLNPLSHADKLTYCTGLPATQTAHKILSVQKTSNPLKLQIIIIHKKLTIHPPFIIKVLKNSLTSNEASP